jgi:hypothetical protein
MRKTLNITPETAADLYRPGISADARVRQLLEIEKRVHCKTCGLRLPVMRCPQECPPNHEVERGNHGTSAK